MIKRGDIVDTTCGVRVQKFSCIILKKLELHFYMLLEVVKHFLYFLK